MDERKPASFFLPVLLLALAAVVWSGFQASQLYQERASLASLRSNQETTLKNAEKMRNQLDALSAALFPSTARPPSAHQHETVRFLIALGLLR